jgi:oligopeptide/dipeptide ABC transporter ATP-binding protein
MQMKSPLINIKNLSVKFGQINAAKNVTFDIHKGETVGLVGESGCGKSTIGKAILNLLPRSSGSVCFEGKEIDRFSSKELGAFRQKVQMIFQDPYSALNPRMTIEQIIIEPLLIHCTYTKIELKQKAQELIEKVDIPPSYLQKRPQELSGGQRQRINIARAIALDPEFIFCDEPVSSLDSIHQKEIIQLLQSLQESHGVSYLFVSHDLPIVNSIAHHIAVMYLGEIVEWGTSEIIKQNATHPYTQALFSAVPIPNPEIERKRKKIILKGEIPSPLSPPTGCPFHTRCPNARPLCRQKEPPMQQLADNHWAKCHFPGN